MQKYLARVGSFLTIASVLLLLPGVGARPAFGGQSSAQAPVIPSTVRDTAHQVAAAAHRLGLPARDFHRIWALAANPPLPDYMDDLEVPYSHWVETGSVTNGVVVTTSGRAFSSPGFDTRPTPKLSEDMVRNVSKAFTALGFPGGEDRKAAVVEATALQPGDILVHPDQENRRGGIVVISGAPTRTDPYRYPALYVVDGMPPYRREIVLAKGEVGDAKRELREGFFVLRIKNTEHLRPLLEAGAIGGGF